MEEHSRQGNSKYEVPRLEMVRTFEELKEGQCGWNLEAEVGAKN